MISRFSMQKSNIQWISEESMVPVGDGLRVIRLPDGAHVAWYDSQNDQWFTVKFDIGHLIERQGPVEWLHDSGQPIQNH